MPVRLVDPIRGDSLIQPCGKLVAVSIGGQVAERARWFDVPVGLTPVAEGVIDALAQFVNGVPEDLNLVTQLEHCFGKCLVGGALLVESGHRRRRMPQPGRECKRLCRPWIHRRETRRPQGRSHCRLRPRKPRADRCERLGVPLPGEIHKGSQVGVT